MQRQLTSPPENQGWETAEEIRKRHKMGVNKFGEMLRRLVASGDAERFAGTEVKASGRVRQQTWYRIKRTT